MALLDGFKVIPLKERFEDSYLTISEKSLKLNNATAKILGSPQMVLFYLNEKKMQIALTPADPPNEDAVLFVSEIGGKEKPIYVKDPAILKAVHKLTVLQKDGVKVTQMIKGVAYPEEKVIIYALSESVEEIVKPRGRRKKE